MSIHIRTIEKAVLVPASVLALSLTLAAPPALAQPAATVFVFPQDGIEDCANGAGAASPLAAAAGGGAGAAALEAGQTAARSMRAGGLAGAAVGMIGCTLNTAIKMSKGQITAKDIACSGGRRPTFSPIVRIPFGCKGDIFDLK